MRQTVHGPARAEARFLVVVGTRARGAHEGVVGEERLEWEGGPSVYFLYDSSSVGGLHVHSAALALGLGLHFAMPGGLGDLQHARRPRARNRTGLQRG